MDCRFSVSRRKIFAVFLLFSSCTGSDRWTVSHLGSHKEGSSRLTYSSQDAVNGLDLEFLRVGTDLHTYLQVHSQSIPPLNGNPKEALVVFKFGDKELSGVAFRHEGGQRLMLPPAMQQQLINALKEEKQVTIRLQGYQAVIDAASFPQSFGDLQSSPLQNPIQLPFKL